MKVFAFSIFTFLNYASANHIEQKCLGGQVYNLCAMGCQKTCKTPDVVCTETVDIEKCVAKCQCPAEIPIWHNGRCIAEKECVPVSWSNGGVDAPLGVQKLVSLIIESFDYGGGFGKTPPQEYIRNYNKDAMSKYVSCRDALNVTCDNIIFDDDTINEFKEILDEWQDDGGNPYGGTPFGTDETDKLGVFKKLLDSIEQKDIEEKDKFMKYSLKHLSVQESFFRYFEPMLEELNNALKLEPDDSEGSKWFWLFSQMKGVAHEYNVLYGIFLRECMPLNANFCKLGPTQVKRVILDSIVFNGHGYANNVAAGGYLKTAKEQLESEEERLNGLGIDYVWSLYSVLTGDDALLFKPGSITELPEIFVSKQDTVPSASKQKASKEERPMLTPPTISYKNKPPLMDRDAAVAKTKNLLTLRNHLVETITNRLNDGKPLVQVASKISKLRKSWTTALKEFTEDIKTLHDFTGIVVNNTLTPQKILELQVTKEKISVRLTNFTSKLNRLIRHIPLFSKVVNGMSHPSVFSEDYSPENIPKQAIKVALENEKFKEFDLKWNDDNFHFFELKDAGEIKKAEEDLKNLNDMCKHFLDNFNTEYDISNTSQITDYLTLVDGYMKSMEGFHAEKLETRFFNRYLLRFFKFFPTFAQFVENPLENNKQDMEKIVSKFSNIRDKLSKKYNQGELRLWENVDDPNNSSKKLGDLENLHGQFWEDGQWMYEVPGRIDEPLELDLRELFVERSRRFLRVFNIMLKEQNHILNTMDQPRNMKDFYSMITIKISDFVITHWLDKIHERINILEEHAISRIKHEHDYLKNGKGLKELRTFSHEMSLKVYKSMQSALNSAYLKLGGCCKSKEDFIKRYGDKTTPKEVQKAYEGHAADVEKYILEISSLGDIYYQDKVGISSLKADVMQYKEVLRHLTPQVLLSETLEFLNVFPVVDEPFQTDALKGPPSPEYWDARELGTTRGLNYLINDQTGLAELGVFQPNQRINEYVRKYIHHKNVGDIHIGNIAEKVYELSMNSNINLLGDRYLKGDGSSVSISEHRHEFSRRLQSSTILNVPINDLKAITLNVGTALDHDTVESAIITGLDHFSGYNTFYDQLYSQVPGHTKKFSKTEYYLTTVQFLVSRNPEPDNQSGPNPKPYSGPEELPSPLPFTDVHWFGSIPDDLLKSDDSKNNK